MATQDTVAFYKAKGKVRYTLIIDEKHKEKLTQLAKQYKITQGDVIEAMLDEIDIDTMGPKFEEKRESKDPRVVSKHTVVKALQNATPEELIEIRRMLEEQERARQVQPA